MRGRAVLVQAYGGEPLRRVVWGEENGRVMILNPDHYEAALQGGPARPVGFPSEYVFDFDLSLYERLRKAYTSGHSTELRRLWTEGKPYRGEPQRTGTAG